MSLAQALEWEPTLDDERYEDTDLSLEESNEDNDEETTEESSVPESMDLLGGPRGRRLLTREEEISLAKRIEKGDMDARQQLVDANHRLVFSVVNKYRYSGVPMEDLVQEGFLGLIQAADKFDYRRGCRFSTVATIWIKAHVLQAIQNLRPLVHVPQRVANASKRMWRASEELTHQLHRPPTADELADRLDVDADRVHELTRINQDWTSLDEPVGEDGETPMMEMLADSEQPATATQVVRTMLREKLHTAMARLSDRERQVLAMRFGLDDGQEHTLDQIGQQFGLTRQRIKEIEATALNKLRSSGPLDMRIDRAWVAA